MSNKKDSLQSFLGWKTRWVLMRNKVLGSSKFQEWAAKTPVLRSIARRKASAQFDLVAGFVYTQITMAYVKSGLLGCLAQGPKNEAEIGRFLGFSDEATRRILLAGRALELSEEPKAGSWLLGEAGAALSANEGVLAMIKHHELLYKDLADPIALLGLQERSQTQLAQFWHYATDVEPSSKDAAPYSALMRATQPMVWRQIVGRYPFGRHSRMLDIGGGSGAFVEQVGAAHLGLELGVFDLPDVIPLAAQRFAGSTMEGRVALHKGSFQTDSLPTGFDLITLIRILHDHHDDVAESLLHKVSDSLPTGGRLLIVEPMAQTPCAKPMGDAYFGMYLWAMGSGRPRASHEIHKLLKKSGFSSSREISTPLPIVARAILATR
jgi:demethylspheroidene O-methyltransferase